MSNKEKHTEQENRKGGKKVFKAEPGPISSLRLESIAENLKVLASECRRFDDCEAQQVLTKLGAQKAENIAMLFLESVLANEELANVLMCGLPVDWFKKAKQRKQLDLRNENSRFSPKSRDQWVTDVGLLRCEILYVLQDMKKLIVESVTLPYKEIFSEEALLTLRETTFYSFNTFDKAVSQSAFDIAFHTISKHPLLKKDDSQLESENPDLESEINFESWYQSATNIDLASWADTLTELFYIEVFQGITKLSMSEHPTSIKQVMKEFRKLFKTDKNKRSITVKIKDP